jgi:hypothetical protein
MTLAELQAMTEREIDALVAEKVLPKKFAKEEDRHRWKRRSSRRD